MKQIGYNTLALPCLALPCLAGSIALSGSVCQAYFANSICKFLGVPRPYYDGRGASFCVCSASAEGGAPP